MGQEFQKNICQCYGTSGRQWLEKLPLIVDQLSHKWSLTALRPVRNMSWSYVVYANKETSQRVILKVVFEEKVFRDELKALYYFRVPEILTYDVKHQAFLMRRIIPGKTLRSFCPNDVSKVINAYVSVVKHLMSAPKEGSASFTPLRQWVKALERADEKKVPTKLLKKAEVLKNNLLETSKEERVLHGDLHDDNIILDKEGWVSIDPRGVVGEVAFEVAAFDLIHETELTLPYVSDVFEERVRRLAYKLNLDPQRVKEWVFVRLVLGACWNVEDGGEPDVFLKRLAKIFPDA